MAQSRIKDSYLQFRAVVWLSLCLVLLVVVPFFLLLMRISGLHFLVWRNLVLFFLNFLPVSIHLFRSNIGLLKLCIVSLLPLHGQSKGSDLEAHTYKENRRVTNLGQWTGEYMAHLISLRDRYFQRRHLLF